MDAAEHSANEHDRLREENQTLSGRVAEDHDLLIELRIEVAALKLAREKGGEKMWSVILLLITSVASAIGAIVTVARK